MDTNEIYSILQADAYTAPLLGDVIPYDLLPNPVPKRRLFVLNLDPSGAPGTHWTLVSSLEAPRNVFYFNSYGDPPPDEILPNLASTASTILYNDVIFQSPTSAICGQMVTVCCLLLARQLTPMQVLDRFPLGSENAGQYINDVYVYKIIENFANLSDKPLINWDFFA